MIKTKVKIELQWKVIKMITERVRNHDLNWPNELHSEHIFLGNFHIFYMLKQKVIIIELPHTSHARELLEFVSSACYTHTMLKPIKQQKKSWVFKV